MSIELCSDYPSDAHLESLKDEIIQTLARPRPCSDCGSNTRDEYYVVHDAIWFGAGNVDGMLCIGCLEQRLGRQLVPARTSPPRRSTGIRTDIRPSDFSADHHRARMNNLPGALFPFMWFSFLRAQAAS
jgi:hypothetical protein